MHFFDRFFIFWRKFAIQKLADYWRFPRLRCSQYNDFMTHVCRRYRIFSVMTMYPEIIVLCFKIHVSYFKFRKIMASLVYNIKLEIKKNLFWISRTVSRHLQVEVVIQYKQRLLYQLTRIKLLLKVRKSFLQNWYGYIQMLSILLFSIAMI